MTRKGKIGDFVVMVASLTKSGAKQVVLLPTSLVSSLGKAAFGNQFLNGATLFYGQLVCGNMLGLKIQCPFNGVGPNFFGELRQAEYQVYTDIHDSATSQDPESLNGLS